ncbi:MAG: IS66 family transposase [bacterium]|nr:IS66 family transposase [bacterium]
MDKDAIIEKQAAEIKTLKEYIHVLEKKIERLEERIAQLEKNSGNSSKPPSSDIVKPPKILCRFGRKRKCGGQHGHRKFSRQPFEPQDVDEVIEYELKDKDAVGLKPLNEWFVIQQVELPEKMYRVIEHRARKYLDTDTGKIHIAPMPDGIRKGGLLGIGITAAVAFMKGRCHTSYTTIQQFFKEIIRLDVSRGMLCKATQKVSLSLQPSYEQLAQRLPQASRVGADETGHHDRGNLHWTWCFDTSDSSVFRIDKSRGSQVPETMLGKDFAGIVGADYWGAYRKYARLFGVKVQYCMAHLIREIRFLAEHSIKKLSRWGHCLLEWLKKLFKTLHGRDKLTAKGFLRSLGQIKEGFLSRMRRPPDHTLAKKLAKRFKGAAAEDYFRFLTEPGVEPTNNGTERQIRPVVIDRRITQGTRGQAGMRWCERIWTILATCKKQDRDVFDFIRHTLLAHWNNTCYPLFL